MAEAALRSASLNVINRLTTRQTGCMTTGTRIRYKIMIHHWNRRPRKVGHMASIALIRQHGNMVHRLALRVAGLTVVAINAGTNGPVMVEIKGLKSRGRVARCTIIHSWGMVYRLANGGGTIVTTLTRANNLVVIHHRHGLPREGAVACRTVTGCIDV